MGLQATPVKVMFCVSIWFLIGGLAESARSRRGVGVESSQRSLFFVGQNRGVATPPAESWQLVEGCVLRLDVVFDGWIRGVGAGSAPSMHARIEEVLRRKGAMTKY